VIRRKPFRFAIFLLSIQHWDWVKREENCEETLLLLMTCWAFLAPLSTVF
jgi:hypothetical protein